MSNLITEERIPWDQLEKVGIKKEFLSNKDLDTLSNYGKTGLLPISVKIDGLYIRTDAKLSLRTTSDGNLTLNIHCVRKEPQLDWGYRGHKFSDDQKKELKENGRLATLVEIDDLQGGKKKAFIGLDKETNEVVHVYLDKIKIADTIKGVEVTEKMKQELLEGRKVLLKDMQLSNGNTADAHISISAERRGLEFEFLEKVKEQIKEKVEGKKEKKKGLKV